ncbi:MULTISPECIES: DUF3043 domain-containing protein [unclassified Arthrobacter]|uniref:DUF3043 domain-containing protein n=1 Tax=unclassified Arthrobacter TaxID=235627 RepID=UPI0017ED9A75|nr:DUF3043 domain-containing protein [Arthrobacter sp. STN4]MCQ9164428.1 DUF3043 domain-containing protein [Arthrobacter sp. STN4]NVM97972.1 DUF3043 domain-containing protein [Arthrobacter sp. SDTb3-6]
MFGRKKDQAPDPQATPAPSAPIDRSRDPQSAKGVPTPSRKEREAARKRPLVPNDRAAAKEAARDARREEQARMRRALDTGEERFLPIRDKGPQKRFARDFVDARFSLGEYVMFLALAIVILTVVIPSTNGSQVYIFLLFWVMVAGVAIDAWFMSRKLKRQLVAKFKTVDSGVVWYGTMRSLQFRRLRLPKPMVKRGEWPS